MLREIYFDESYHEKTGRIGVSATMATTGQWEHFVRDWGGVLAAKSVAPGEFHAQSGGKVQRELNLSLAGLLSNLGICSTCVTLRTNDFEANTTLEQRGNYGGVFGFARYVAILSLSLGFEDAGRSGEFAYYADQGGRGLDWFMQTLRTIAANDSLRRQYRLTKHGVVDRRVHLPVHAADLVAHEVITHRHTSEPLNVLGRQVLVDDWNGDEVREVLNDFSQSRERLKKIRDKNRR